MYKYSQNGNQPHCLSSDDVMAPSSDPDVDRDECSDETDDIAAPLPTEEDVMSRDHGWGNRGGRLLAKDKRKLREKRRSTGVVKYTGSESRVSIQGRVECRSQHYRHGDRLFL